jgi:hypothetical protein
LTGAADNGAADNGAGESGAGDNGAGDNGAGDNGAGDNGAGDNGARESGAQPSMFAAPAREPGGPEPAKASSAPDLFSADDEAIAIAMVPQMMRRVFASPKQAVLSLRETPLSVCRALAYTLTHPTLRPVTKAIVSSVGKIELCGMICAYLLSYHQGYGMAQADMAQGRDYHADLTRELGQPAASN